MLPNKRLFAISLAGIAVQLTMAYPALQDDPSLKTYGNYAFDILPTTNGVKQRFPQERDHAVSKLRSFIKPHTVVLIPPNFSLLLIKLTKSTFIAF